MCLLPVELLAYQVSIVLDVIFGLMYDVTITNILHFFQTQLHVSPELMQIFASGK